MPLDLFGTLGQRIYRLVLEGDLKFVWTVIIGTLNCTPLDVVAIIGFVDNGCNLVGF